MMSETPDDFLDEVLKLVGGIAFEHDIDSKTTELWRIEYDDESRENRVANYYADQTAAMECAQRAVDDGDAGEVVVQRFISAAALNASTQRDAERKLLEKMAELHQLYINQNGWNRCWLCGAKGFHESDCNIVTLLAEYAALQAEVSDG